MRRCGLAGLALWAVLVALAPSISRASNGPVADAAAFRGQGHLAFLWAHTLYILDGDAGVLRHPAGSTPVAQMAWSPDGAWLAYIRVADATTGSGELWLARPDGAAQRVTGLAAPATSFSWLPRGHTLSVTLAGGGRGTGRQWLVTPPSAPRAASLSGAYGLPSPDGTMRAYSAVLPYKQSEVEQRSDALYTVPAAGGRATRQYTALHGGIALVRWWPNSRGLVFWLDPYHSNSIAADGLGLYTMPLGGAPRLLTTALAYADWLSWSPSGHSILLVTGTGREVWHDKALMICDVIAPLCRTLPRQPGAVAVAPAWSPHANRIAFVQARDRANAGAFGFTTTQALMAWVQTHTLWVADGRGAHAHRLAAAGTGVYQPRWSADGRHILYIRDDALWLIDAAGGAPARIAGPFPGTPDLFGFYGHPSWPITLAWSTR